MSFNRNLQNQADQNNQINQHQIQGLRPQGYITIGINPTPSSGIYTAVNTIEPISTSSPYIVVPNPFYMPSNQNQIQNHMTNAGGIANFVDPHHAYNSPTFITNQNSYLAQINNNDINNNNATQYTPNEVQTPLNILDYEPSPTDQHVGGQNDLNQNSYRIESDMNNNNEIQIIQNRNQPQSSSIQQRSMWAIDTLDNLLSGDWQDESPQEVMSSPLMNNIQVIEIDDDNTSDNDYSQNITGQQSANNNPIRKNLIDAANDMLRQATMYRNTKGMNMQSNAWKYFKGIKVDNLDISNQDLLKNFFFVLTTGVQKLINDFYNNNNRLTNIIKNLKSQDSPNTDRCDVLMNILKSDPNKLTKFMKTFIDSINRIGVLDKVIANLDYSYKANEVKRDYMLMRRNHLKSSRQSSAHGHNRDTANLPARQGRPERRNDNNDYSNIINIYQNNNNTHYSHQITPVLDELDINQNKNNQESLNQENFNSSEPLQSNLSSWAPEMLSEIEVNQNNNNQENLNQANFNFPDGLAADLARFAEEMLRDLNRESESNAQQDSEAIQGHVLSGQVSSNPMTLYSSNKRHQNEPLNSIPEQKRSRTGS